MEPSLRAFFEEQVQFRLRDGTEVEGGVFIGSTEFLPVEILREDPDAFREEFDLWLTDVWKPEQEQRRAELLTLYGNDESNGHVIAGTLTQAGVSDDGTDYDTDGQVCGEVARGLV